MRRCAATATRPRAAPRDATSRRRDADARARAMGKKPPAARASAPAREGAAIGGNWAALRARINAGASKAAKAKAAARRALEDVRGATDEDADAVGRARDARDAKPKATGRNTAVTTVLALDCEMVGVGVDGKRSILARVSIVNDDGNVIMDKFVIPTERVTDYRTAVSGVRAKDLTAANGAVAFKKVQAQMSELLKGRILVGHSLKNDMRVLMLDHPKRDTRDTSLYHPLTRPLRPEERCVPGAPRGRGCRALRDLARQHLGLEIQKGEHSSVDDARATLALYKKFAKKWEGALRRADGKVKFKKRRVVD